ncbi:FAD:protein FMN transferase [Sagittula sp. MA-2]|uniref:FAD:protein FMN transferase n=1 Tax=Sagittula sp. MA-2 TaxID=3048007 RepID=UPI00358F740F
MVGLDSVTMDDTAVRLGRSRMALTPNGVAQGCATNSLSRRLHRKGLRDVMNAGEICAVGRLDGQGWSVQMPSGRSLGLTIRAVATSTRSAP